MKLQDKVAIITGSTKGIGRATAKLFAQEGAKVIVCGTTESKGLSCVDEIKQAGGEAMFIKADMTDESSLQKLITGTLDAYGKIDILVNNAGVGDPLNICGVQDVTMENWDRVMQVNLKAPFILCKLAIPEMEKRGGGVIINTASVASTGAGRGPFVYTVSKHAMIGLTRELSIYHGQKGIRVNSILPGGIATDMIAGDVDESNPAVQKIKASPAGTLGHPDQVAKLMVFLASEDSSYIHGESIVIDGGFTLM